MNKKNNASYISQKDNFSGNHGYVVRSSAIFYYKKTKELKTTISFMNYWKIKRSLEVMIIASTRSMSGELILRDALNFCASHVINYRPAVSDNFEGSVEIEVFGNTNMVIPYAAVMAVYETCKSISMVHSYGRTYSPHEVEENRTISNGNESCWTIRDDSITRSFCVFHNGYNLCPPQDISLTLTNASGEKAEVVFSIEALAPYQSVKICPRDHFSNIERFLGGQAGNASLSYELANAFTRLLVGNETKDEMQVTHSNFNYAIHETDLVGHGKQAYMNIVNADFDNASVVIYPDCHSGHYTMLTDHDKYDFDGSKRLEIPITKGTLVKFKRHDGTLPTRIVTAFSGNNTSAVTLPFECSLGIHHDEYPKKRSHWGLIACSKNCRSRIISQCQNELFGEIKDVHFIDIRIFTFNSNETLSTHLIEEDITTLHSGQYIDEIFPECEDFLGGDFGYIYITTNYPGLSCFTTLENEAGSMTFEHTF